MENAVTIEKEKLQRLLDYFFEVCSLCDEGDKSMQEMQEMKEWVITTFVSKVG